MNKRQKQIVEFAKENQSFQNKNLIVFFDSKYSRETITRDLSFLCKQNILNKSGAGAFVVYSLSESYEIVKEIDVEKYFKIPYLKREVKENFNFDIFTILENDIFTAEEKGGIKELNEKEYLSKVKNISDGILKKETERLLIEFSWKSSQIEGNTYSILETETLIKENIEAKGHSHEEALMILGHRDAFEYVWQNKANFQEITVTKIENIHKLLIKEMDIAQNIRQGLVGIGGTKYLPLDNEFQIREALEKTCAFINDGKINPVVRAVMAVLLISYIQPFEDGNKRTARMIGNAILIANDYCPLSYRAVEVIEYKKAVLLFYEINNISYFKQIFIEQFEDAVKNYFN